MIILQSCTGLAERSNFYPQIIPQTELVEVVGLGYEFS